MALAAILAGAIPAHAEEEAPVAIAPGRTVSIEYTLKLGDGSTADSNVGEEPLVYKHGGGQILPALEESLVGLKVNDSKEVTLTPEQGYGPADPSAFETVSIDQIPEEARHAGAQLMAQSPTGERLVVRVHEVKPDEVVLDMNHVLAGQTLHFAIRILSIE